MNEENQTPQPPYILPSSRGYSATRKERALVGAIHQLPVQKLEVIPD